MHHLNYVTEVYGNKLYNMMHASDVARMHILLKQGGMYIDFDVIALRSLDKLRVYPCTLGVESGSEQTAGLVNAGLILAEPNSTFIRRWLDSYRNYNAKSVEKGGWLVNSGIVPTNLTRQHPNTVHVESNILHDTSGLIFSTYLNLTDIYVIHMWLHLWKHYSVEIGKIMSICDSLGMNNTYGDLARRFYIDKYFNPAATTLT